jgi:ABC-type methionine transport system ATPase subunit
MMAKQRLHLTFPEHLIEQPIIYRLSRDFNVVPNITRANVDERFAWVVLELEGTEEAIAAAAAWLGEQGIQVDRIPENDS